MSKMFNRESRAVLFLNKVADLMLLNLEWLLGSLGIFTAGAAATALYRCLDLLDTGKLLHPFRDFRDVFRREWKQSTALWLPMLGMLLLLAADFYIIFLAKVLNETIWKLLFFAVLFFVVPVMLYVFPLQAKFRNSKRQTYRNAALLALMHYPKSLAVTVISFAPLFLFLFFPDVFFHTLILFLLLGKSVPAYWSYQILHTVFKSYMSPGDIEKEKADISGESEAEEEPDSDVS